MTRMQNSNNRKKSGKKPHAFPPQMQRKLALLFLIVLAVFLFLAIRLISIVRNNNVSYERKILSQRSYDSVELPFKRGQITDVNGTVLADSELVYNVIVDAYQINDGTDDQTGENPYLEPTLDALESLGCDRDALKTYIEDNPDSRYYIAKKNITYTEYTNYENQFTEANKALSDIEDQIKKEESGSNDQTTLSQLNSQKEEAQAKVDALNNIRGIWFEENYIRNYPYSTLASDVIGFANDNDEGSFGIEGYYNNTLNGTAGREYGYLDSDSDLERTTIEATDGNNVVLTIDANIQSICEKYLKQFNDKHQNEARQAYGANDVGVIIENVNTGEILAMASYPNYDLNDPYNLDVLQGMPKLDDSDNPTDEYLTADDITNLKQQSQEEQSRYLNALWTNYCITGYYEPGSVFKPFTLAAGLESGKLTGNDDETWYCNGALDVGGWTIKCHSYKNGGDGIVNDKEAIERSCNVALMQMAMQMGVDDFTKFERIFGFGLKTNIDLQGEARTDNMIIPKDNMSITDLATNSFGQNIDVTMIQMISAFSSLINGGYYYQPHVVSKITSSSGSTIQTIEPTVVRKTVSEETSEYVREATLQVVEGANGTGHKARPAGYRIGGKTGTAETLPRGNGHYVVSFMGYAPYEDPQIAIYVVINQINMESEEQTSEACLLVHDILTEVLPYMGIDMTVPLTADEEAELQALNLANTYAYGVSNAPVPIANNFDADGDGVYDSVDANGDGQVDTAIDTNNDQITDAVDTDGDGKADLYDTDNDGIADSTQPPITSGDYVDSGDTTEDVTASTVTNEDGTVTRQDSSLGIPGRGGEDASAQSSTTSTDTTAAAGTQTNTTSDTTTSTSDTSQGTDTSAPSADTTTTTGTTTTATTATATDTGASQETGTTGTYTGTATDAGQQSQTQTQTETGTDSDAQVQVQESQDTAAQQ